MPPFQKVANSAGLAVTETIIPGKPKTRYHVHGLYMMAKNTIGTNSSGYSVGADIDGSRIYFASLGLNAATADRNQESLTGLDIVCDWGSGVMVFTDALAALSFVALYYSEEIQP